MRKFGPRALLLLSLLVAGIFVARAGVSPGLFLAPKIAPNRLPAAQAVALISQDRDPNWLTACATKRGIAAGDARKNEALFRERPVKFYSGNPFCKEIALTFDDGPHPGYTERLLDVLHTEGVPVTFFVVGKQAEKYPELIRAEADAGHTVANHTYHHVSLPKIPIAYAGDEIAACDAVLRGILGKSPHLFRPPGGEYDRAVIDAAESQGYTTVLWTDDPGDYASPGEEVILARTLKAATPGGILLLHDGIQQTIDVLPRLIESLRREGYRFVTVDRLLADRKGTAGTVPHTFAQNGRDGGRSRVARA